MSYMCRHKSENIKNRNATLQIILTIIQESYHLLHIVEGLKKQTVAQTDISTSRCGKSRSRQ